MTSRHKKKIHHCSMHSQVKARGRCSSCGRWICRECAVLKNGRFYCKDGCSAENTVVYPVKVKEVPQPRQMPVLKSESDEKPAPKTTNESPGKKDCRVTEEKAAGSKAKFGISIFLVLLLVLITAVFLRDRLLLLEKIRILEEKNVSLNATVLRRNAYIAKLKGAFAGNNDMSQDTLVEESPVQQKVNSRMPSDAAFSKEMHSYSYKSDKLPWTFNNGATDRKIVALTFDGGSHLNAAAEILDTLLSRDVKTTMFFTGEFIRKNKDFVRRVGVFGHEVGNHTYSHLHYTDWGTSKVQNTLSSVNENLLAEELKKTNVLYRSVTGKDLAPLWRAPYGEFNAEICGWGARAGYLHVGWKQASSWWRNYDTNDWVPDESTPGYYSGKDTYEKFKKLSEVKPYGMNGAIILMHLGTLRKNRDDQVHPYLGVIIDDLRSKGYRFVTVTEMIRESGVDLSLLQPRE